MLRVVEQWEEVLLGKLELFAAPPDNYIPGVEVDLMSGIPASKYRALMKQSNSPFMLVFIKDVFFSIFFYIFEICYLKSEKAVLTQSNATKRGRHKCKQ